MPTKPQVVSILATIASICMVSAPIATAKKMEAQRSIGIMTPTFFCAQFVSCVIWSVNGVFLNDGAIITCNVVGTAISTYCLLVFLSVARQEEKSGHRLASTTYQQSLTTTMIALGISLLSSTFLTVLFGVSPSVTLTVNGILGSMSSVFMLSSPLAMAGSIIKKKNAEGLAPLTMSFALLNTFLWFLYGILTTNFFLIVPQLLGISSTVFQFVLLFKYGTKPSEVKEVKGAIASVPLD